MLIKILLTYTHVNMYPYIYLFYSKMYVVGEFMCTFC